MSNGIASLREAELKLAQTLAEVDLDSPTLSPETVVMLAKVGEQQRELKRELATNEDLQEAIRSISQQEAQLANVLQNIDLSAIDTSAIESLATSEFVIESAEVAEDELAEGVTVDDGISDEEAQEILQLSGFIAAAATARESAPDLGQDETTVLTFLIFVIILSSIGYSGIAPLVGAGVLSEMVRRSLSAAGMWDDIEEG